MNKFKRNLVVFICMVMISFGANTIGQATSNVISETGGIKISKVVATVFGDTTTTKGFTWYTNKTSTSSDLEVVEKLSFEPNFEEAIKFKGKNYVPTNSQEEMVHKAIATDLDGNTEYFYRVGDSNLNSWSNVGTFKTGSKEGEVTFINITDTQAKTEEEAKLSSETIEKSLKTVNNVEFISLNGDWVDSGKNEKQWDWLFGYSQNSLLNTTIAPVAGNHDSSKNSFIDHFNLDVGEGSDTSKGAYYSYDYSNAHFIVLNNNEDSEEFRNFSVNQIEWLKNDVKEAREDGSEWIIVQMHKGPYTIGNHATDNDITGPNGVRTKVAPLMEELGVDLVLQGHDHTYSRTKALKNGVPVDVEKIKETVNGVEVDYTVNPQGTIYMTPNTAGPKVYNKNKDIGSSYYDLFEVVNKDPASQEGDDSKKSDKPERGIIQNFISIKISGDKLTSITYEINQKKNNGEPYIIDTFGILKES
ncbi:metallophosphoesterase family protein [Clostridium gasigenes]|uniref:purple acid phosphatase family protein n=1 Tax=Clostridium gasigenes TaxID=94869 RepID=UPI00162763B4|nr:metallophosphoesterase family protein [Clostridium gasigenes]MBB6622459.1 metallophosphoesterase family protein [Clostridium gasigenes]